MINALRHLAVLAFLPVTYKPGYFASLEKGKTQ